MNTVTHLDPHQVPATLRGNYSGRKFSVEVCDRVTLRNTYWSGGTRSTYSLIHLASGERAAPNGNAAPFQFGGDLEGREVDIPEGCAVREHVIFCGEDLGLRFYVRAADVAPLLPPKIAVTDDELAVLAATATYKNTYSGRTGIRFAEAAEATGITRERWDNASRSLVACAMLNGSGAITVKGRNALGSVRLGYRGQGLVRK